MGLDWWTFGLETANFLVLVLILRRYLYRPVLGVIARRKQAIDASLSDAEAIRERADAVLGDYQRQLAEFAGQQKERLERDREAIQEERRRLLERAHDEAEERAHAVRETLARERDEALVEVREQAAKLAVHMAESLLREADIESVTERFFERACAYLAGLPETELLHMVAPRGSEPALEIRSAVEPSARAVERWRARLAEIVRPVCAELPITLAVDESLVAGVELVLAGAIVRFAWGDTLRRAEAELSSDVDAA